MALIKCFECGKQISDKADSCPHCGCPKTPQESKINIPSKPTSTPNTNSSMPQKKNGIGCATIGILIFMLILLFGQCGDNSYNEYDNGKDGETFKRYYDAASDIAENPDDYGF